MIVIIYETLSDQLSYVEDIFSLIWLKSLLSVILPAKYNYTDDLTYDIAKSISV
jgi:hypothetical protein